MSAHHHFPCVINGITCHNEAEAKAAEQHHTKDHAKEAH